MTRIEGIELVGLAGKRGSGKDTVGNYLKVRSGAETFAFANPLKIAAMAIFGFTYEQVYGALKGVVDPFWGFTPGWALQKLGTEGGRNVFGQDLWVRAMERRLRETAVGFCVVTDVRFPNEAEAIKAWGGKVYLVTRPINVQEDGRDSNHLSETALDGYSEFDGRLVNDSTIEHLEIMARRLITERLQEP